MSYEQTQKSFTVENTLIEDVQEGISELRTLEGVEVAVTREAPPNEDQGGPKIRGGDFLAPPAIALALSVGKFAIDKGPKIWGALNKIVKFHQGKVTFKVGESEIEGKDIAKGEQWLVKKLWPHAAEEENETVGVEREPKTKEELLAAGKAVDELFGEDGKGAAAEVKKALALRFFNFEK